MKITLAKMDRSLLLMKNTLSLTLALLGLVPFFSRIAHSYPQFIGHGYPSCLNCHYNPLGNGPLNDYGRAVGADAISSGALYPKSWSEEKIAETSGFLFMAPKLKNIRAQANYRGLWLNTQPGTVNQKTAWIHMQANAQLIFQFLEENRLTAVGELGYSPPPRQQTTGTLPKKLRSREYYFGYRVNPAFGIYTGFMDKAFGLRVSEHILFSRSISRTGQNDQTHGVLLHLLSESWEGALHAFAGNLLQTPDLRQKGASFILERSVLEDHRLGISAQSVQNNYLKLTSYATHARLSLLDGSALLAEIGQSHYDSDSGQASRISRYGLLQTYLRPWRGVYLLSNIEYLKNEITQPLSTVRWGPGIQVFPIRGLELRLDAYQTRNFSPLSASQDSWMVTFQTHVWL